MTAPLTPEQVALNAASEFEAYAADCRRRETVARYHPLPGIKRMSWPIPASWGEPLYVYPGLLHGYKIERMGFANGEQLIRMRVPISGFDNPATTNNKDITA